MSRQGRFHDRYFVAQAKRMERRAVAESYAQWMPDMAAEAHNEGWELVSPLVAGDPYTIRPLSPALTDAEAETFVHRRAAEGSGMHKIASAMCGWG